MSQPSMTPPRISVGLPVYNGEAYLREALDSILNQTFTDLELIICDNASTDATQSICREYAANDGRIRYHRHEKNIGAGPNFNYTVTLARGAYFKWAAHDDLCSPELLEKCAAALDANPDAVLAFPRAQIIDVATNKSEPYVDPLPTDHADPATRFDALMRGHPCYQVFGLIRMSALRATPLIGLYAHGDGVLLCQLALLGRFIKVPEILFFPRRHDKQSMTMVQDYRAYARWFDPRLNARRLFPWWRIYWELLRSIFACTLRLKSRAGCVYHWAKWVYIRRDRFFRDIFFNLRHSAG